MDSIDAEAELARLLNEEISKYWDELPLGYDETNDGYHMGKGLMVNKKTWDDYCEKLKEKPELNAYEFMVDLIKEEAKKL